MTAPLYLGGLIPALALEDAEMGLWWLLGAPVEAVAHREGVTPAGVLTTSGDSHAYDLDAPRWLRWTLEVTDGS